MKKIILFFLMLSIVFAQENLEQALRLYEKNQFAKAYEVFDRLCEKGSAKACFSIAYMNENSQGIPKNLKKAHQFYDKSCTLGLAKACSNLALLLNEEGYENDAELALNFYKKSCDLKDARACYKLGSIYEKGEFVRQNLKSSLSFYSQSCSFGFAEACYLLGRYNEKEKKDMQSAKRYFGMACDKKHKEACEAYKEFVKKGIEIY